MTKLTDPLGLVIVRQARAGEDDLWSLVLGKRLCSGETLKGSAPVVDFGAAQGCQDDAAVLGWLRQRYREPWTEVVRVVGPDLGDVPDLLAEDADRFPSPSPDGRLSWVELAPDGFRIKLDDQPDALDPGYGPLVPVLATARAAGYTHVRLDPDGDPC